MCESGLLQNQKGEGFPFLLQENVNQNIACKNRDSLKTTYSYTIDIIAYPVKSKV